MKKGDIVEGIIEQVNFPNKGIMRYEDRQITVKNGLPGQVVAVSIMKLRKGKAEARIVEVLEKAPFEIDSICPHFDACGGCTYQNYTYEAQLELKEKQVKNLIDNMYQSLGFNPDTSYRFLHIKKSPFQFDYRNKMEFSFGDEYKNGPLSLGMHKRGSFYDIVTVEQCKIADADFHIILTETIAYFKEKNATFFHKIQHSGFLRHLLVRKATKTGEILIVLVTSTQDMVDVLEWGQKMVALENSGQLLGTIAGILHTKNDSMADMVQSDETDILYGKDYFFEEILGMKFKISPFSFFQTNSLGAEVLYETARDFIGELVEDGKNPDKIIFDLYSGTGTIAQMLAPVAREVVGVEIVEEAVEAAKENAKRNGLNNCTFIAGDVLKVLDEIVQKPDFIILDPPRDGLHPKAILKIINYGVDRLLYISCKPTSLVRDLEIFLQNGYIVEKVQCVDMFPGTVHVETIVALHRKDT